MTHDPFKQNLPHHRISIAVFTGRDDTSPGVSIFVLIGDGPLSDARSGEIVELFYDGQYVVKTGDSSLLVIESTGPHGLTSNDIGRRFGSLNLPREKWEGLPG